MRRLAHAIVVYTERQAAELRKVMPDKPIIAAPNAILSAEEMVPARGALQRTDFIYVGRMTEAKKPDLLVRAFASASGDLPEDTRLVMVGDGPRLGAVRELAARLGVAGRVVFKGHVSDPEALRGLYATSIASVSPGYVGLSITQSFAYGVPMLVARHEPHSPEIEAAIEGFNAFMFDADSVQALCRALSDAWRMRDDLAQRAPEITAHCRTGYSVEGMVSRIVTAIEVVARVPTL
jgi:glycosyltransferase involved in cell wall biosynthesis